MIHINWSELFPGKWSVFIFISYMALFVNQGIIVTSSQSNGDYDYNIVVVVLMTEVLKIVVCVVLYCWQNNFSLLFCEMAKHGQVLLFYMVPSFLYCLYNNLAFINLAYFDPTTYYLLMQMRVVITGILFQMVFGKKLSTKQWLSLVILTLGCMTKHLNLNFGNDPILSNVHLNISALLIFVQATCSCLAGVYNEYLLKGQAANIDLFLQNIFMYINSIFCNLMVIAAQDNPAGAFENMGASIMLRPKVIAVMINNAAIGITTSFFLKNLNSILKTFASALELMFTAILCWIIFDIPIHLNTVIAIAMVSYAVLLYSQNPVQNSRPKTLCNEKGEGVILIDA